MKKTKIKILLFLFITTISLLITAPSAYAFSKNQEYTLKNDDNGAAGGDEIQWATNMRYWSEKREKYVYYTANYNNVKYYTNIDGVNTNLYCLDPGVSAPTNLLYSRTIFDPQTDGGLKSGDYGLIKILDAKPEDYGFADDGYWYNVQSLAVRLLIDGYKGWAKSAADYNHGEKVKNLKNHAAYARGAGSTVGFKTSGDNGAKVLAGAEKLYMTGVNAAESYNEENSVKVNITSAGEIEKNSEENNNDNFIITEINPPEGYNPSEPSDVITKTKESLKILEIDLKNFNKEEGNFTIDSLEVTSGSTNFQAEIVGVSFQNTKIWDDYTNPIALGTNVFEQFSNMVVESENNRKNLHFYLAIKATTTAEINIDDEEIEEEICEKGTARLKYSYDDPETFSGAVLYGSHDGKTVDDEQRFVFITKNKQKMEGIYDKIEDTACASYDSCTPVICVGDKCEGDKTLPQVCEDGVNPDKENNVEYKFLEAYQNGKYTIKKCLLKGKKDAAENSYQLVDYDNASAVANNPYCSIMCKEDYVFKLPYKINTTGGSYFSIKMNLKGQQDCYSTSINYDQYDIDILDQTINVMEAYNEWAKYYELVNSTPTLDESKEINCYKTDCEYDDGEREDEEEDEEPSCDRDGHSTTKTEYEGFIEFEKKEGIAYYVDGEVDAEITLSDGTTYTADTSRLKMPDKMYFGELVNNPEGRCEVDDSSCSVTGYDCDITTAQEDYNDQKDDFEYRLKRAKGNLESAVDDLKAIIDKLNSCIGDHKYQAYSKSFKGSAFWDMVYKYEPEIKYSYDEPNPTDSGRKWIDEVIGLGDYDIMSSKDAEIKAEFCESGSTNCTSVAADGKVESIFSTKENPQELNVNTYCVGDINGDYSCKGTEFNTITDHNAYEYVDKLICEESNGFFTCDYKPLKQTKINYLHKVAVASGTYDTKRVYYTGHDDGDIYISFPNSKFNSYSVVKGLPVGANTPQGTYFYILAIDNIGTFYSNGELGRIYGTNPDSLSNYAREIATTNGNAYQNQVTITNDNVTEVIKEIAPNEYACSYDVSQNSCIDGDGHHHDSNECRYGTLDKNWNDCKKRICGSGDGSGYCVKTAEGYYSCNSESYSKETCTKYPNREAAIAASFQNYNCCPNCTVECIGKCLIVVENDEENDAKLQLDFRPITTANINPNNRQLGYNWDSKNGSNYLVAQKAGNTISEIEARASGQTNYPGALSVNDYALKVTMTPDMITWIKKYNNEHINEGNYNNDTLICYDYTLNSLNDEDTCEKAGYLWQNDKCIMSNVFCYSTFIDDLEASFYNNVDAPNRAAAKNNAYSNFNVYKQLSEGLDTSGSNIVTNDYWTIYEYTTLDVNGDGIPDIGPSWK